MTIVNSSTKKNLVTAELPDQIGSGSFLKDHLQWGEQEIKLFLMCGHTHTYTHTHIHKERKQHEYT